MERRRYSTEEKVDILKKSNGLCAHCGKELTLYGESSCSIEHSYPFSKGGEDVYENIIALCHDCNSSKGNATFFPEEYYSYLNDKYLKILCDYVESKCYKKDYPLGDVTRFVYDNSERTKNVITRQKDSKNKRIIMNRTTPKAYLYAAYPADADEILKFIIKSYTYRLKQSSNDKKYRFVLEDEWLAKRALQDTLKYDRVYVITNSMPDKNKYIEYQAYIIFNRLKDITINDPSRIMNNINGDFFLTGYNFYKAPLNVNPMLYSLAAYCKENSVFVPILEFCRDKEYPVITYKGREKYDFVTVKFENTTCPIPKGKGIDYSDQLMFFRIPKCITYGQPASAELYQDILSDNYKSEALRYA